MANVVFNPTWAGREVMAVAENDCRFVRGITKKLADDFMVSGVKLGATVGLRLPQRWVTNKGQGLQIQGINDTIVYVTITDQANIGWSWSSITGTLEVQDAYERFVNPAGSQMSNTWDKDGLGRVYQDVYQAQGTPGVVPVSNATYYNLGVDLDNSAVPRDSRIMIVNSIMGAAIANANVALFGPRAQIDEAFEESMFSKDALDWKEWWKDVNVFPHTYGTYAGTPTVNGANQTGSTLVTQSWSSGASTLNRGDVFTIGSGTTGTYAVNPQNYQSTTNLQRFVNGITTSDTTGAMTITISPTIITSGAYQTVVASPSNSATINVLGATGALSPQGLGFHKQAFVMASAPPIMPNQGKAKIVKRGQLAIRVWEGSDIMSDQHPTRLDSFYGFRTLRQDWAGRIQS
ncbi:MAG TPA: P22 phage major capsid protein family protein [Vicinamibacterales bacterium]|nr:P22 phage major capsid protein family protein [Vicinamibacterales bacterium]